MCDAGRNGADRTKVRPLHRCGRRWSVVILMVLKL